MSLFLPFQNGEKIILTAEAATQRNGTAVAKQALRLPGLCPSSIQPELNAENLIKI